MTGEDILNALESFLESGSLTSKTLWDLGEASLSSFSYEDAPAVLDLSQKCRERGSARKTALVVSRPYDFGICKVYQAKVHMQKIDREIEVFYSTEEALEWLADREWSEGEAKPDNLHLERGD